MNEIRLELKFAKIELNEIVRELVWNYELTNIEISTLLQAEILELKERD